MRQEIAGTLTAKHLKTHVRHEFDLPHGAARLRVRLEFPPGSGHGHMLCLSLFDSRGFRGSGHRGGCAHEVVLSETEATPGYLPGAVAAGTARIVLHAHRLIPGEPCPYRLLVEGEGTAEAAAGQPGLRRPGRRPAVRASSPLGPSWYRGDLHAHTVHSDGDWDLPGLISGAREAGLDFVALTEHNTVSQLAGIDDLPPGEPLAIAGMELTTFHGHALSLGTWEWIDWGVLAPQRAMADIAEEVRQRGGLFVIAHPRALGDPVCTGCDWRYDDMMPGAAPAVEIWNGPWSCDNSNEGALSLWYAWLNRGCRLVATAGTDAHAAAGIVGRVGFNVVWAEDRTEAAVLRAVRRGHLYLSAGPRLQFSAVAGPQKAMVGDRLAAESADIQTAWSGCPPGSVVRLIGDGAALREEAADGEGARRWDGVRARWCAVEVRDGRGEMAAITNPIFLEQ